jgi:hypothetical protein
MKDALGLRSQSLRPPQTGHYQDDHIFHYGAPSVHGHQEASKEQNSFSFQIHETLGGLLTSINELSYLSQTPAEIPGQLTPHQPDDFLQTMVYMTQADAPSSMRHRWMILFFIVMGI